MGHDEAGLLLALGRAAGRGTAYTLPRTRWECSLQGLAEDQLWNEVRPALRDFGLTEQELGTVGYAFTEMVNNTIDHSRSGTWL